ncbi:ATP-binding protein [Oceanirhabdus sp. W0125-5]|uniref:ATP-binding protein n=1 Tax=Oceanirhabdus sp. W0125-5 TaxID=2999116 RepID=UPI0022F31A95|nr:ATP-binding protein [Oceanirhabdus sp. W0125-5]WBW95370.1 ATP-binding protein [Oceanirhabdus sp. W0125-5]
MKKNQFIMYGLTKYKEIIDKIINELKAFNDGFEIKLILTEALTNALKHGNNGNRDKPIYLRYSYDDNKVVFEIEDSGDGFKNLTIPNELIDETTLNENGRGLFLINCIADKIESRNNVLIIEKNLS